MLYRLDKNLKLLSLLRQAVEAMESVASKECRRVHHSESGEVKVVGTNSG